MLRLSKILLPVDFSERSAGAAHLATDLARQFRSELTLLHVLARRLYAPIPMDATAGIFADQAAEARNQLDAFLPDQFHGVEAKRVVLEGDPARTIVAYAHSEKIGLIVMPTHGYGPFRRFLLGSVTAKVLHDADCPVATGAHLEKTPPLDSLFRGNLACAVDLGPQSEKVLEWAARMARELQTRLTVIHAVPPLEAHAGDYFEPNWRSLVIRHAQERIAELTTRLGIEAEVFIESGDAPRVVRCAAERLGAGLLVIGRGSAAGIFGRLRANAYAILRESPCPVVSV